MVLAYFVARARATEPAWPDGLWIKFDQLSRSEAMPYVWELVAAGALYRSVVNGAAKYGVQNLVALSDCISDIALEMIDED